MNSVREILTSNMKRREKVKLECHFRHETPNLKNATCYINVKYKFTHETKNIRYAIVNVNYATTFIKNKYK